MPCLQWMSPFYAKLSSLHFSVTSISSFSLMNRNMSLNILSEYQSGSTQFLSHGSAATTLFNLLDSFAILVEECFVVPELNSDYSRSSSSLLVQSYQSSLADISICGRVSAPDQTNLAWIAPDLFAVVLLM